MPGRGGPGGGPTEAVCGVNEAVSQLRAWRSDGYQIRSIELICQNVRTGATHVINARGTLTSPDAHSGPQACKLPERATGLVICHGKHVNGLGLVCDQRVAPAAPSTIALGSNDQEVTFEGAKLRIFTYRPSCNNPNLLVVLHGVNRNAGDYRDWAKPIANALCLIVVTPLFDATRFPDWAYAKGGIMKDGVLQPQAQWSGHFVNAIASWVQAAEKRAIALSTIGHSAGAQFSSRFAAFTPTGAKRIVVANPGSHGFPDPATKAPYGCGGVYPRSQEDAELKRDLAAPVTLCLGQGDAGSDLLDEKSAGRSAGRHADRARAQRVRKGQGAGGPAQMAFQLAHYRVVGCRPQRADDVFLAGRS